MAHEWENVDHALAYLALADTIAHRSEGEAALLEEVSPDCQRILDLGTGDGRLLALLLLRCPEAQGIAVDFSPAMIEQASERFHGDDRVRVIEHDLRQPLPDLGTHDAVCSSFAIHHVSHERKRSLYQEIWRSSNPVGCSATWSTCRLQRSTFISDSSTLSVIRRMSRTSSSMSRRSWFGYEKLDSRTSIASGSGGSWLSWSE